MMSNENKINICFMTDDAIENLRENSKNVTKMLRENPHDSNWLKELYKGKIFQEKEYKIPAFELITSIDCNYRNVDFQNSKKLYESMKHLPRYILTDERFWAWVNFTIGYKSSLQAMPIRSDSTFGDHWLFNRGQRRGIFFGVMSRCFFRVELTVDDSLNDKYELTKFVFQNQERIRNLTWRSNSNAKHIVLGAVKAEKAIYDKYINDVKMSEKLLTLEKGSDNIYTKVARFISIYGSAKLLDAISEEEIYSTVYEYMHDLLKEKNEE